MSYSELESLNFKRWKKGKETNTFWLKLILAGVANSSPLSHKWQSCGPCKYILKPCGQVSIKTTEEPNHRQAYISGFMPQKLPQMFWTALWSLEVATFSDHLLSTCTPIICCFDLIASSLDFEKNFLCREICCCCRDENQSSSVGLSQTCQFFYFFLVTKLFSMGGKKSSTRVQKRPRNLKRTEKN